MDEIISKLAVIQIIEKMRARIGHNLERAVGRAMIEILDEVGEDVEKLPSAQPEIIYCGECTKMKVDSVFHDCWCSETGKKVWINHYCGYAERKEGTT